MTRIVIADDHNLVRHGVRTLLEAETDFTVVGEAADGLEAVRLVETLHPDVVVLDMMMGGMNGLEATRHINKKSAQTKVVIFSMNGGEAYIMEALQAGANGYVLKDSATAELVQAIREVEVGHRYLSSSLSEHTAEPHIRKTDAIQMTPLDTLTAREREVLQMCAQGYTNTGIASKLCISPRTVEVHRSHIMRKLGLKNQTDLIHYVLERQI